MWNNSKELAMEYANDLVVLRRLHAKYKIERDKYLSDSLAAEECGEWDKAMRCKEAYLDYRLRCRELSAIISSSQYSIDWLKAESEPRYVTSVKKLPYTNREVKVSDVDQALIYLNQLKTEYRQMTEDEKTELDTFLNGMSTREREVFISIKGKSNTYEETSNYLGISKASVQKYLERAEKKVLKVLENDVQTTLF